MPLLRDSRSRPATPQPRPASLRPVAADESLAQAVGRTAGLVAPVWPLADYVAVNPFLGLVDRDWLAAREFLRSVSACETLPSLGHFRSRWLAGSFTAADIDAAIDELMRDGVAAAGRLDTAAIVDLLPAPPQPELQPARDPAPQATGRRSSTRRSASTSRLPTTRASPPGKMASVTARSTRPGRRLRRWTAGSNCWA